MTSKERLRRIVRFIDKRLPKAKVTSSGIKTIYAIASGLDPKGEVHPRKDYRRLAEARARAEQRRNAPKVIVTSKMIEKRFGIKT